MLTKQRAMEIAGRWHGGQWTALYAFSSSGIGGKNALDEVQKELSEKPELKGDVTELTKLKRYLFLQLKQPLVQLLERDPDFKDAYKINRKQRRYADVVNGVADEVLLTLDRFLPDKDSPANRIAGFYGVPILKDKVCQVIKRHCAIDYPMTLTRVRNMARAAAMDEQSAQVVLKSRKTGRYSFTRYREGVTPDKDSLLVSVFEVYVNPLRVVEKA